MAEKICKSGACTPETCAAFADGISDACGCALVDIPTTAAAAGIFNTLVAALGAAELVDTLSEPNGPYTVFAPTDDAFNTLPDGLVACLLEDENNDVLSSILQYHVVNEEVLSKDLEDGAAVETLQGDDVTVDLTDGVKINESTVVTADIITSNGVIHAIDAVLV
ncbi:NFasciclin-like protein, partial [Fragilariopsis cylindrus CCMP1102]